MNLLKFKLNKKINIYINYKTLLLFIYKNFFICYIHLSYFYFFFFLKRKNYIYNNINFSLLLSNLKNLKKLFFNQFNNNLKSLINYIYLHVDGLYYRIKYYKKSNALAFLVGYNHYMLYFLPEEINVVLYSKRRKFILYSLNKFLLTKIASCLVSLDYPSLYKSKGIKIYSYNFREKKMKKKR